MGKPQQPLFVVLSLLAVGLGIIDLTMRSPFLILYEGVAANLIFAALFAVGAMQRRPLVQDFAERAADRSFARGDKTIPRFFRAFTWAWALYFLLRAGVCLATALIFPLETALAVRAVFATVTMVGMIAASFLGKQVYFFCLRRGLLGASGVTNTNS
jgi:uncharacterized membrane protein